MALVKQIGQFKLWEKKGDIFTASVYKGSNQKLERVLCYVNNQADAIKLFEKKFAEGRKITDRKDAVEYFERKVKKKNKHCNPQVQKKEYKFKSTTLGRKLKRVYDRIDSDGSTKGWKNTRRTVLRRLNESANRETNITKALVERVFLELSNRGEKHLSPITIDSYRKALSAICSEPVINKDAKSLMKDIKFKKKHQLKNENIEYGEKDRRHLERSHVSALIPKLYSVEDEDTRKGMFIQLWTGARPSDAIRSIFTQSTISLYMTKTMTNVSQPYDEFFKAYVLINNIPTKPFKVKEGSKRHHKVYEKMVRECLPESLHDTDRYCLRHTALTQRTLDNVAPKEVAQLAGHCSLKMLDSHYANKVVFENKPFSEVVIIDGLPESYHGFLLQESMFSRWPELKCGTVPDCDVFRKAVKLIKEKKSKADKVISI